MFSSDSDSDGSTFEPYMPPRPAGTTRRNGAAGASSDMLDDDEEPAPAAAPAAAHDDAGTAEPLKDTARKKLLPPPPVGWRYCPTVVMADGATQVDAAVARVSGAIACHNNYEVFMHHAPWCAALSCLRALHALAPGPWTWLTRGAQACACASTCTQAHAWTRAAGFLRPGQGR